MKTPARFASRAWLALVPIAAGAGCGPDLLYIPSLAVGQSQIVLRSVPIDEALAGETLTDEIRTKLQLIREVRDFARDRMGMTPGDSFKLFYDNTEGTRTYNVSASRKDRFDPVTWSFPIVGTLPYLGFFDRDRAERQLNTLRGDGFDAFMYEVDAYSTLDVFPNPVQATMLRRDAIALINTVIHEILHNTVWRRDDVTFNESLATFFGRNGTVDFLRERAADHPELVALAVARFEDTDRYNDFIFSLYRELEQWYGSDRPRDEKIAGREAVFQAARDRFVIEVQPLMNVPENYDWVVNLPTDNAWMLANYRYNLDLDLFDRVHQTVGGVWAQSIPVFSAAAAAPDPKAYLRDWLDANAPPTGP